MGVGCSHRVLVWVIGDGLPVGWLVVHSSRQWRAGFTLLGLGLGWIKSDVAHVRTEPSQARAEPNTETVANRHQLGSVSGRRVRIETVLEERLPERS